ncbi:MAG: BadF/BadG/BcrA/BcrD ATPase family protein [Candidatus Bathyarchaeia archaeon]
MPHEKYSPIIAGLDVGASATKAVLIKDSRVISQYLVETSEPISSAEHVLNFLVSSVKERSKIKNVAVSGGGSKIIGNKILGFPVRRVDEIIANGYGGLFLSKKRQGIIVTIGTGTSIVAAYEGGKKIVHLGGTGIGGGTILGLSRRMLGVNEFTMLENMALKGDTKRVDLTVRDVVGGSIGIIPAEATASNLAKLCVETSQEDVAAGIFNLVSQVVGVVSSMAAKSCGLENDVIFVGRLAKSPLISKIILETVGVFGVKAIVPENCEYCTAMGAAIYVLNNI